MMIKKITAFLMAIMMSAAVGCGSASESATQSSSESKTSSGSPTEVQTGYPIKTDEPITLTYWVPMSDSAAKFITSYDENIAYQKMMENTGINLKFLHPASGKQQWIEQFNLIIASNDLPDIMGYSNAYNGGEFQGMYDGVFVDLTDKLPTLAPDYWKLILSDPEFFREVSDENGRIAAFCGYKPKGDPQHMRPIIQQEILDQFGMEVPKVLSDYEALFAKMLEAGITPYMMDKSLNGVEEQFVGMFGIFAKSTAIGCEFSKDAQGNIQFGHILPEFKEYLTLMNSWYQKGYLSKDFGSTDLQQARTLLDTQKVGMLIDAVVASYNRTDAQGIEIASAPYPRINAGDVIHYESADLWPRMGYEQCTASITKDCKNVDEAIRMMNYAYTQEGADLMNWGVEGVNWDYVDGKRTYNDTMLNNDKFGTEEASYIYKVHFAPKLNYLDTTAHANLLKSPGALASRMEWSDDPNVDSILRLPPFTLSSDALKRRTQIMTNVNTYCNEMVLKFIVGTEPLENFDQYVEVVKSMGIEEAISLTQEAYNSYMNKKLV